jgi:hypothetical protein
MNELRRGSVIQFMDHVKNCLTVRSLLKNRPSDRIHQPHVIPIKILYLGRRAGHIEGPASPSVRLAAR